MGSLILLYNRLAFDHSDSTRYFRRVDFCDFVGPSDFEVPGFTFYALCRPSTFKTLCSVPGRSFKPLELE